MNREDLPIDDYILSNSNRVAYLIAGYIQKKLCLYELNELNTWVTVSEHNVKFFDEITGEEKINQALSWYKQLNTEKALERTRNRIGFPHKKNPGNIWIIAAVVISIIISAAGLSLTIQSTNQVDHQKHLQDRAPGTRRAELVLDDGKRIELDESARGKLANQGNTEIILIDSLLNYRATKLAASNEQNIWNIISTPRGGTYDLMLADGTRVYLNAGSMLRYPVAFNGKERKVELTGEAFFEVRKNTSMPFLVLAGDNKITVKGTHFNVSAYPDQDTIRTTVLEGSVLVSVKGQEKILKPGEEAMASVESLEVTIADIDKVMGWRQGNFVFHDTPMKEMLQQMERWYNIEIINRCKHEVHFNATFPRTVSLSKLMAYLQGTGVIQFAWEGTQLIVTDQN